ncbi:PREDICTED: uncharacterized protein LOC109582957 isoform X1 [Amphimedon queenslandica]|uniref:NIDO domain-containing protein n=1 Tax=Amphimedon queenslandica TaxID=400682 RepID=A0AAN0J997_AMPQE|nr:PREDICTED: uncharacterized protein LOC109582957 isoform X1 [Amphimedon queenslandica]|eukprot:XP_019853615.1 PREDICTED: uncharacterized protein LOC109582957 isoform X1 [Amphimedon queenslandica]
MMIVFVILIYFNGLLVSSESNYFPFLYPTDYSIISGYDDYAKKVLLPSSLRFGSCHTEAWISTNGLISLGTSFTAYGPNSFPITTPVIAPFWDDININGRGEVRYDIITPTTNLSLCNQVNDYLSTSTGSNVSVEWILWAYWHDVCPFGDNYCNNTESNHFQVVLAHQSNATYAVFIYKCGLIRWTRHRAGVGINSGSGYYINHPLSRTNNATNIDCYDAVSGWTNVVYRLDQVIDRFELLSITPHNITVSWNIIPNNNSTLVLNITNSLQTVNDIITATEYNNVYNYTKGILYSCNAYTFKLALPMSNECNDSIRIISTTAMTPKPDNVSASYLNNETLITRFQIQQCFINNVQLILFEVNGHINTSDPLDIDSLQYIDEFYIIHWNIKLNNHSLYYLTVSAIGTYKTSTTDVTEINTYNVKDIIIERNKDIVCFICVTEVFNECLLITASTTTTLIPQSIQTNGTCYSFTDNGTYTVYAHDIENGIKILTPAIVIEYTVDWIKPSDTGYTFIDDFQSSSKEREFSSTTKSKSSNGLIFSMKPSTTKPSTTKPSTTKPSTTKPSTIKPSTTLSSSGIHNTTAAKNISNQSQSQIIIIMILGGLLGLATFIVLMLSFAMIIILRKKGKTNYTQENYEIPVITKENPTYDMMSNKIPSSITNSYYETVASSTTTDACNSAIYYVPETRPQVFSRPYKVGHFK